MRSIGRHVRVSYHETEQNEAKECLPDERFQTTLDTGDHADDGRDFTAIMVADVKVTDGTAALQGVREVYRRPGDECVMETQDFRQENAEIMVACYDLGGVRLSAGKYTHIRDSAILGIDVASGQATVYRDRRDGSFSEVEGIAPSGDWTMVECGPGYGGGLDLCRLNLDRLGNPLIRLTRVLDYGDHRVSNPVISPDGSQVAFQIGRGEDEAGVGRGILIMPMPPGGL